MSPDVRRIHLRFATKINDGHMGSRYAILHPPTTLDPRLTTSNSKFWRLYLPRLKYHNPAVPMTVERTEDQQGPATMTVTFATQAASNAPSSHQAPPEQTREHTIDMKGRLAADILIDFEKLVQGRQVEATPEEQETLASLAEQRERSDRDRKLVAEVVRKKRREQEILEQARRSIAGAG